jgi:ribosome-associated translation inhibitor RaiA
MNKPALLIVVFLAATANPAEPLQPGELIEGVDASTVMIKCSGIADGTEAAVLHARQGCVEWYVLKQLTFTREEKDAYRAKRDKIFSGLDQYIERPAPGARSGRGTGIKAQVRISDTQIRVIAIVKLYKKVLRQELASMGVIPETDLAISIIPSKSVEKSKYRKTIEALLAAGFLENGWKADSGRPKADVHVEFDAIAHRRREGKFQSIAFSVNLTVRKKSGELLAAGAALSAPRAIFRAGEEAAAVQEATLDAIMQIERGLEKYSHELAKKRSK